MVLLNIGSRAQVMHKKAKKTSGGLKKTDLKYNKRGKIVSKKASILAKKNNRLVKAGYLTKKGHFGYFMKGGAGAYGARAAYGPNNAGVGVNTTHNFNNTGDVAYGNNNTGDAVSVNSNGRDRPSKGNNPGTLKVPQHYRDLYAMKVKEYKNKNN